MKGYMSTKEAATYLGYDQDYICYLCIKGKLPGAEKLGDWMWSIPEKSVYEYKPGLQGFAVIRARKKAEQEAWLQELNAAITDGKARRRETE